jgi:hypothetical protein
MNPKVDLVIGELILRDLPYGMRHQIATALEQELSRLLAEQGLPPSLAAGASIPSVLLRSFHFSDGAKPGSIGVSIAQQVYGQLQDSTPPLGGTVPSQEAKG